MKAVLGKRLQQRYASIAGRTASTELERNSIISRPRSLETLRMLLCLAVDSVGLLSNQTSDPLLTDRLNMIVMFVTQRLLWW